MFQQCREIININQEVTALHAQVTELVDLMECTQYPPPAVKSTILSAVNNIDSGVDSLAVPKHEDKKPYTNTNVRYGLGQHNLSSPIHLTTPSSISHPRTTHPTPSDINQLKEEFAELKAALSTSV